MSVVDEIQVTENGDIEVRIIPPDSLSTLPDVLATYRPGTQAREYIMDRCLRRIAHSLQITCDIVSLVHGGEDRYTVITSDGDYVEVDAASNKTVSDAINDLASLVETLEFATPHNTRPDIPQATGKRDFRG